MCVAMHTMQPRQNSFVNVLLVCVSRLPILVSSHRVCKGCMSCPDMCRPVSGQVHAAVTAYALF